MVPEPTPEPPASPPKLAASGEEAASAAIPAKLSNSSPQALQGTSEAKAKIEATAKANEEAGGEQVVARAVEGDTETAQLVSGAAANSHTPKISLKQQALPPMDRVPLFVICPITMKIMVDPVVTADGHSVRATVVPLRAPRPLEWLLATLV